MIIRKKQNRLGLQFAEREDWSREAEILKEFKIILRNQYDKMAMQKSHFSLVCSLVEKNYRFYDDSTKSDSKSKNRTWYIFLNLRNIGTYDSRTRSLYWLKKPVLLRCRNTQTNKKYRNSRNKIFSFPITRISTKA